MNLPVVAQVAREPYVQGKDARNVLTDSWGPAESVDTNGWWFSAQTSAPSQDAHRGALIVASMLIPGGTVCADKDRWTVNGGTYYQVGTPEDYNHGPWGMTVPLVVHLTNVKW